MKNLLPILPLLIAVACSKNFEDEYLLCKTDSYKSNLALTYDLDSSMGSYRYKYTQDELLVINNATPSLSYSLVKKDEKGYRYFEDENGSVKHKYHPVFRDIETTIKREQFGKEELLIMSGQCTKQV